MAAEFSIEVRKAIRVAAHLTGTSYKIIDIDGFSPPTLCGEGYYWTTPSGKTRVRHPGAYKWRCVYHPSTMHIEVGRGWLIQNALA